MKSLLYPFVAAFTILASANSSVAEAAPDWRTPYIDNASSTLRFEYDNDLFLNSDNNFSSGFAVQWHSDVAADWNDIDSANWLKYGQHLPGLNAPDRLLRLGVAVGQNIQTPTDLKETQLINDDVPYVGALGFETNWIAFNDDAFTGYALIVGIIGPASGAEATQRIIHKWIGSEIPQGWDNQIPNEFAINFNGMFKRKVARWNESGAFSADLSLDADFGLGTALTFGEVALEFRAGYNLPLGFTFVPDPIGRTIAYDAMLTRKFSEPASIYFSVVHRRTYMQHFIFTDGSLWHDTHHVEVDRWQHQTIVGLHVRHGHWGIHLNFWDSSTNVDTRHGGDNDFGTIALEWRY